MAFGAYVYTSSVPVHGAIALDLQSVAAVQTVNVAVTRSSSSTMTLSAVTTHLHICDRFNDGCMQYHAVHTSRLWLCVACIVSMHKPDIHNSTRHERA
jgi:hypothetical protein